VASLIVAVVLGLALFPVVLVFGPVYFPWSLLVLAAVGAVVGLVIPPERARSRLLHALGLALLMVAVVLGVFRVTSNLAPDVGVLFAVAIWSAWLLLPLFTGVLSGATLRAAVGIGRGAVVAGAGVLAIALLGAGLAFAAAPPEVAGAPTCDRGFECPRTQCASMAERRRFLAIERVTVFDGTRMTCTYTAWGGVYIGRADIGRGGSSWTDGAWPEIVGGRGR